MTDHSVSEKYRKYLVSIHIKDEKSLIVWGTDIMDEEEDKLLVDNDGNIVKFNGFQDLKVSLLAGESILFDSENFKLWLKELKNDKPYVVYDFNQISVLISERFENITDLHEDVFDQILDIQNLILDYSYQIKDVELLDILNNANNKLFRDYSYNEFSRDPILGDKEGSYQRFMSDFKPDIFIKELDQVTKVFLGRMISPSYGNYRSN